MQQPIALAAAFFAVGGMAQWSYTDCSQLLGGSGYVSPSTLSFPSIPRCIITYPLPSIIIIINNNPLPHNHLISLITKTTQVCSPDYTTVSYCQPGLDPEVVDSQYCDYGDCWADRFNGFCTYGVSQKNSARGPTDCTQVNPEGGYVCSEDYTTLVSIFILFFIFYLLFFLLLLTAFVFFFVVSMLW